MATRGILIIFCLFMFCSLCYGETLYFKNGRKIEGQIIERTDAAVKIKKLGVTLTFYIDEIDRIDDAQESKVNKKTSIKICSRFKNQDFKYKVCFTT